MICIGIAFVFWFFTKLSEEYKTQLSVQLHLNLPKDKIFSNPVPSSIEVEVKGKGWDLLVLEFQADPVIEVQVTEEELAKDQTLSLESRIYKLFSKVTVLDIRPTTVSLALEEVATKQIPVYVDQQVELAEMHSFRDSIRVQPAMVQITGPASVVRDIHEWKTVPLILQNVRDNFQKQLPLQRHPNGNVHFSPAEVACEARIEAQTEKKLEVPIEIRNIGDTTRTVNILPKKIEVVCMVGLSRYDQLSAEDFTAYVDFQQGKLQDQEGLRVRLDQTPPFVQQVHFYPRTVDYIIRSGR